MKFVSPPVYEKNSQNIFNFTKDGVPGWDGDNVKKTVLFVWLASLMLSHFFQIGEELKYGVM